MASKIIRINYFKLECKTKDETGRYVPVTFDIDRFLMEISQLELEDRTSNYKSDISRLESFGRQRSFGGKYRSITFNRLSESNIPKKSKLKETSKAVDLLADEYIDKECNVLYDNELAIMAIQNNIGALTYKGIEDFLSKKYDNEKFWFQLTPVRAPDMVQMIKDRRLFKKIIIKLYGLQTSSLDDSTSNKILIDAYNNYKSMSASNGTIEVSMGYDRSNCLDVTEILTLVDDLEKNKGIVSKAEFITRKGDTDDEEDITVLNFLQMNLSDFIDVEIEPRQPLSADFIIDQMVKKFVRRNDYLIQLTSD